MGASTIIENHIKSTTSTIWDAVPVIPAGKLLDFDLSKYNKSFVNLAIAVGVVALAKTTFTLGKSALKSVTSCQKLSTSKQLKDKYGHHSWVLVADCNQNEQFCQFFAKNGFNVILMGEEADIRIAKDKVQTINPQILTETIIVDWKIQKSNLKYYEHLVQQLKHFDISFLVLPKLIKSKECLPSHLEQIQPFEQNYLLVRFFGQKLRWRCYRSGIIFPSYEDNEPITKDNGITKSLIAGNDAFGRIIGFEFRQTVEVIVARGSVENAIKGLGKVRISH